MKEYYSIERHLKKWTKTNQSATSLWAAWIVDKERYTKNLASVSLSYPHYSKHDVSHSKAIISNVELILGEERIKQLGYTDAWLILQVAYGHDLGMVVPAAESLLNEIIKMSEEEIKDLEERMRMSVDGYHAWKYLSPLFDYRRMQGMAVCGKDQKLDDLKQNVLQHTRRWEGEHLSNLVDDMKLSEPWPTKLIEAFTLLAEELHRPVHPKLSKKQLKKEAKARSDDNLYQLYMIAADIAQLHGEDHDAIIKTFKERQINGFGNDYAHPRFIACMLRLGDLLDLRNNRFDRKRLSVLGNNSYTSLQHLLKHKSVWYSYRPNKIVISANFDPKIALDVIRKQQNLPFGENGSGRTLNERAHEYNTQACKRLLEWIDWIRKELHYLSIHWRRIVPKNFSGSCPILEAEDIILNDEVVDSHKVNFTYQIDAKRSAEIIEGAGMYSNRLHACLRELIQNAIDATKIQLYHDLENKRYRIKDYEERKDKKQSIFDHIKDLPPIYFKEELPILDSYRIDIKIKEDKKEKKINISIRDQGIGISLYILSRMKYIGDIRNPLVDKVKKHMPKWLHPTGGFGIGMQSVFLLTDTFDVLTCSHQEHDNEGRPIYRKIRFNSSRLGGEILIGHMNKDEKRDFGFGTEIRISLPFERISQISLDIGPFSPPNKLIKDMILSYVRKNCAFVLCPIYVNGQVVINERKGLRECENHFGDFLVVDSYEKVFYQKKSKTHSFCYWNSELGVLLQYYLDSGGQLNGSKRLNVFFKGILVDDAELPLEAKIPFWDVDVHILHSPTDALLEINRERFLEDKRGYIAEMIRRTHLCCIKTLFRPGFIQNSKEHLKKLFDFSNVERENGWFYMEANYTAMLDNWTIVSQLQEDYEKQDDLFPYREIFPETLNWRMDDCLPFAMIRQDSNIIQRYAQKFSGNLSYSDQKKMNRHDAWFFHDTGFDRLTFDKKELPHPSFCVYSDQYIHYTEMAIRKLIFLYAHNWMQPIAIYRIGNRNPNGSSISMNEEEYWDYIIYTIKTNNSRNNIGINDFPVFPGCGLYPELEVVNLPRKMLNSDNCKYGSWMISPLVMKKLKKYLERNNDTSTIPQNKALYAYVKENSISQYQTSDSKKTDVSHIHMYYSEWLKELYQRYHK